MGTKSQKNMIWKIIGKETAIVIHWPYHLFSMKEKLEYWNWTVSMTCVVWSVQKNTKKTKNFIPH